jgi:hypothetical protein
MGVDQCRRPVSADAVGELDGLQHLPDRRLQLGGDRQPKPV